MRERMREGERERERESGFFCFSVFIAGPVFDSEELRKLPLIHKHKEDQSNLQMWLRFTSDRDTCHVVGKSRPRSTIASTWTLTTFMSVSNVFNDIINLHVCLVFYCDLFSMETFNRLLCQNFCSSERLKFLVSFVCITTTCSFSS